MTVPDSVRVYVPATLAMLQQLVADGQLFPVSGTAFAVTPTLRESYAEGDDEDDWLKYSRAWEIVRAQVAAFRAQAVPR